MSAARHKRICAKHASSSLALLTLAFDLRVMRVTAILLVTSIVVGCGSFPSKVHHAESQRVRQLELELRRKQAQLEELKERNLVLEQRADLHRPEQPQSETHAHVESNPHSNPHSSSNPNLHPNPVLEPVGTAQTGEHFLYSKVLETYRAHRKAELRKSLHLLLKTYPDSIFADNALYLAGMLAVETNEWPRARAYLDQVIAAYPSGDKVVSALFAKGIIEKRNKKYKDAQALFERVRSHYPGSSEAARAATELKLIRMAAGRPTIDRRLE